MNEKILEIIAAMRNTQHFENIYGIEKYAEKLFQIYGDKIDIAKEIIKAGLWLDDNPKRRKKNVRSFLTRWINRSVGWINERKNNTKGGFIIDDCGYKPTKKPIIE